MPCRMHKALESTDPLMKNGFKLRMLATNWNRFDTAAIDFGSAGRASELLPAYSHVATGLTTITAAPGTFWSSNFLEES